MMTKLDIEEIYHEAGIVAPRNVEGRLREWSRARWYPDVNLWPSESPMYAVLRDPGRATDTAGDGGMASRADRQGHSIARQTRVREVSTAIGHLPQQLRELIDYIYDVPQRERVKTEKQAAEKFGIARTDVSRRLFAAYGWIGKELGIVDVLGRESFGR